MSQATTRKHWTVDEYLAWEIRQECKYELVEGDVRLMTGGTVRHDRICNNLRGNLWAALRNAPCRVQGPDIKVRAARNMRYPDALIDCGSFQGDALVASEPAAVFEVLSKSTAWIDLTVKLRDYNTVDSIRTYALISQDEPRVLVYRRDDSGHLWAGAAELLEGMEASLGLPEHDVTIPFQLLYEGVTFEE